MEGGGGGFYGRELGRIQQEKVKYVSRLGLSRTDALSLLRLERGARRNGGSGTTVGYLFTVKCQHGRGRWIVTGHSGEMDTFTLKIFFLRVFFFFLSC